MQQRNTTGADERTGQEAARKPYEKPRLEIYGNLTEISKANFGSKQADGSGHPNKHFTS